MNTTILHINPNQIDISKLKTAAEILRGGGTVAFPTETVYGIGANALDEAAVQKIFAAKGRPADNPLIVHISDISQIEQIAKSIPETAKIIAQNLWPGAITIILNKKDTVPQIVTAGLDTVAVRMPSHPIALKLIELAGVPIAAPSANLSGKPSPTLGSHVIEDLSGRVDAIIDGGSCDFGIESTVIDLTGDKPLILRPGAVTLAQLQQLLPDTDYDKGILDKLKAGETPKSPGMKYKHYSPKASVIVFEGDLQKARQEIEKRLNADKESGIKSGVLAHCGAVYPKSAHTIEYADGAKGLSKLLFAALRQFDTHGVQNVYCEPVGDGDMAIAVKNRLYKAAGYHIIGV